MLSFFWQELERRGHKTVFFPAGEGGGVSCRRDLFSARPLLFFVFLLPLYIAGLVILSFFKLTKKTDTVVCFSAAGKIFTAPVAAVLGMRRVWLEFPGAFCRPERRLPEKLLRAHARGAKRVVFSSAGERELKADGKDAAGAAFVKPGIKTGSFVRQDNIFNRLARDGRAGGKNFFTAGARLTPGCGRNLEMLVRGVKKCRSVIADIQLVIIGGGEEKNAAVWLAKMMEVDTLTWFVGEEAGFKKWLDGFDVYVSVCGRARLGDIFTVLEVAAAGVPVIASADAGLGDFITDGHNGLVPEVFDGDALARALIDLRQNPDLRARLGAGGKEMIGEYFTIGKMAEEFENRVLIPAFKSSPVVK